MNRLIARRDVLLSALAATAFWPGDGQAQPESLEVIDVEIAADKRLAKRCRVIVPRAPTSAPLPVLVLLHGLGETKSERLGVDAWLTPYGLRDAWQRLTEAPLRSSGEKYLSRQELDGFNRALADQPFAGLCVVCPYMPNPYDFPGGSEVMLGRYTRWLRDALLPEVRARVKQASSARESTGIAGVSLGGYAALEIALRAPETFGTVGTLQGAYKKDRVTSYVDRLSALSPALRAAYVGTSVDDVYKVANERLGKQLAERGLATRLTVRRGPHNQAFLREVGTLELLLWHDRALRGHCETGVARPG